MTSVVTVRWSIYSRLCLVAWILAVNSTVYPRVSLADEFSIEKVGAGDPQSGDFFGHSIALSGDRMVVGALWEDSNGFNSGAAYVFERVGSQWIETQKLVAPDGAADDVFGRSVDIDENTIVIGANAIDDQGFDSGGAYVFEYDGAKWNFVSKLLAQDGAPSDRAGWRVGIDNQTVVISAHRDDTNGVDSGAAYVFVRNQGTWEQQAKLLPADGSTDDLFGHDVAISGDTVLIGAYKDDDNGSSSGSAYIFTRSGDGIWIQQQKITASDANAGYHFGRFVDIDGDVAIIGSPFWHPLNYGSAYVFEFDGTSWAERKQLTSETPTTQENFASDVAIDGAVIITGSLFIQQNTPGKAYLYRKQSGSWTLDAPLLPFDGVNGDQFGHAVAVSGNQVGVGADAVDENGIDTGSAYVFDTSPLPGDLNCDGDVNLLDVPSFVALVVSGEFDPVGDINLDGEVNLLDVEPFVALLNASN